MSRPVAVAVLALLVLAVWGLMLLGWRRRAARQADLPPLPAVPPGDLLPVAPPAAGVYVATTSEGDWLDRVAARGLGTRSGADMVVTSQGVGWFRQGAPDVWAPVAALRGVRRDAGLAGTVVERGGLVVVTWQLGERTLDTGFRPRAAADAPRLVAAVDDLLATTPPEGSA